VSPPHRVAGLLAKIRAPGKTVVMVLSIGLTACLETAAKSVVVSGRSGTDLHFYGVPGLVR